jgi:hypothetical protein
MKTFIVLIVISIFFIIGQSEELSCKEVEESTCKNGTLYKKESFQTCFVSNRYWKKYKKHKLEFLVNPPSEIRFTIVPFGEYQNGSTTVGLTISQFQMNSATSCRIIFYLKIRHTFENGKSFKVF